MAEAPPGPLAELQRELTNQALAVAYDLGETLDFTHRSVGTVEKVLGLISDHYHKSGDDTGLNGLAYQFGAYIASTVQRNFNEGVLLRDHPELGEGTFPFEFRGNTIFPFAWCQKRIFDGSGDNVETKYRILVLEKVGVGV